MYRVRKTWADAFQLTTSHGGRLNGKSFPWCQEPFNSRPHTEVDNLDLDLYWFYAPFQLTTSHGGRPGDAPAEEKETNLSTHDLTRRSTLILLSPSPQLRSFNSRPHTEVDAWYGCIHLR